MITFNDVDRLGQESTSSYTFQVILKSTGEIIFQYNTMTGPLNGATIGWQNFYRTEGASIVYNNANFNLIHDGWAVRIEDINSGLPPPSSFASAASYQTVDLSWVASSSDSVETYVIYRGTSSGSLSPLDSVASTVTSYSNTGLTNGTTYYYGIRSKSSSGGYSVMRTTSATPNVASPTNLSATVTTGQVTLSWTAAIGSSIARTLIYQGTSSSNLSLVDSTSDASTATKTITGLTNNTTYYFYVLSRGTDGSVGSATAQVEAMPTYTGPVWWVSASVSAVGDGTSTSPFRYITSAIAAAAEDDTVKLVAGTYTGANNRGLDTDKNLVFISASGAESTALDAGTYDRHFYFNDGQDSTFQVIGLTLKNGKKSNDNGGSVYIQNSSPIFKNCIFEDNESGNSGGAIQIFEGSPRFRNCIFRNNSSDS
ncbi:MAG: fibronectin type III domain-containing protein, partial [Anaerolineales bacterium]|nr:fibronectin type III domain-containing protein [Anaerolineales bacterium]